MSNHVESSNGQFQVKVVKAYTKKSNKEISLLVGDEVLVLDSSNNAMWFGRILSRGYKKSDSSKAQGALESTTGWFPSANCTKPNPPAVPSHPSNQSSKGGVRLSMRIDASTFRNQITAALGDPGIIVGTEIAGAPPPNQRKHARALHDYTAESSSELSLKTGDIVSILNEDESWWEGEHQNGQIGFFPKDFVQVFRDPSALPSNHDQQSQSNANDNKIDCGEFDDPHAIAIIAQVILPHVPVVPFNDSGLPFLSLPAGAVVALLDSNPNHMYWLAVQYNDNVAPLPGSDIQSSPPHKAGTPHKKRVGLVPKANLAVLEGLAEPHVNYPYKPVQLGPTRIFANRALGSVSCSDGKPACLARVAFEFQGENENEHEYLGVGDLVWITDEDEIVLTEAWVETEVDTKRAFCPTSFLEVLSDRVQAPKPVLIKEADDQPQTETKENPKVENEPTKEGKEGSTKEERKSKREHRESVSSKDKKSDKKKKKSKDSKRNLVVATSESETAAVSPSPSSDSPREAADAGENAISGLAVGATLAKALYAYKAEADSELSINPGDVIRLIDYPPNEEWWEGILVAEDGSPLAEEYIGFFPRDFVAVLNPEKKSKKRPKRGATTKKKSKKKNEEETKKDKPKKTEKAEVEVAEKTAVSAVVVDEKTAAAVVDDEKPAATEKPVVAEKLTAIAEPIQEDPLTRESKMLDVKGVELETKVAELELTQMELEAKTLECQRKDDEIAQLKAQNESLQQQLDDLKSKQTTAPVETPTETNTNEALLEKIKSENEELKAELERMKSKVQSDESVQSKLHEQIENLNNQLRDERSALNKLRQAHEQTQRGPLAKAPASLPERKTSNPAMVAAIQSPQRKPSVSTQQTPASPMAAEVPTPSTSNPSTPAKAAAAKVRALPPTPDGGPSVTAAPPKLAAGAKRSLPPKQPAPSLPADFVKKTAAPGRVQGFLAAKKVGLNGAASPTQPSSSNLTAAETDAFASKRKFFESLKKEAN